MFRSATVKLTVWYLILVMILSFTFSFLFYHVTTTELARGLHHETERIYQEYPVFQDNNILAPGRDYQIAAHRLLVRLILLNLCIFISAGFASYWLARRTLEPIQEAHEQQKRFTADVSHELRTPLTALKMESEVALLNPKPKISEFKKTLTSNLEEVTKLEKLVNNLLRLTSFESDAMAQHFTLVSLDAVATDAVTQTAVLAERKGIKFDTALKPLKVFGDKDSLVQLGVILIDNAIKYSSSGQTVKVSVNSSDGRAVLKVSDQGVGIKPTELKRVFDRFYRADSSRHNGASQGYGLGLSIAQLICNSHNAQLTLSSRYGHGTNASVSISLAQTGNKP